ncbi:MAG: class I SAM-dependent methyltransferase [Xanthobacteraceae bacterium]|nr:class I SAM-dependent methyltransferase [Xanthobacteraceae bacterium]
MTDIQEISLDDLPRWTNWPSRMLGLESFVPPVRTTEKIAQEYGHEKWQSMLDAFEKSGRTADATVLRKTYYALPGEAQRAAVYRGKLVAAHATPTIMDWYDGLLAEWMGPSIGKARTVVELGCGFGQVLWELRRRFPGKLYRGGEYTDSAVKLASLLYAKHADISVEHVNFYDKSYAVIEKAEGPVVVLTSQAIEQIPDCSNIIDTLGKYRDKIAAVFHIEPAYDLQTPATLLGQLRRRYIEINDYNRNLFSTLKSRQDIRIVRLEQDVIGWNPFNSLGMVHWEFVK